MNVNNPVLDDFKSLLLPGEVYEIRIPKYKGTCSGYFNDPEKMVTAIQSYNGKAPGIYISINPCTKALLSRADNRIVEYVKNTTSDTDITRLTRILIDVDVPRPAGISSTNSEHQAALKNAHLIRDFLAAEYNINSFLADSGNGGHIILITDLPNTPENAETCKRFIEAIGYMFDNDQIKIDRSTYNPSRITKLYGTMACKGDNTQDRPHRRSKLLAIPTNYKPVGIEVLKRIAAIVPEPTAKKKSGAQEGQLKPLFAEDWLNEHGIGIAHSSPYADGTKFVLDGCPMDDTHERDKAAVVIQFSNGAIAFKCHHDRCSHYMWQDLREKYDPVAERIKLGKSKDIPEINSEDGEGEKKEPRKKQADVLIEAAKDAKLFHDEQMEPCAVVLVNGHDEIYRIRERPFKRWLTRQYYEDTNDAPNNDSLNQALNLLEAKAVFEGPQHKLNLRVAQINDTYYYDLANEQWQVVRITPAGWTIMNEPYIFRRTQNTAAQVTPCHGGNIEQLLDFINLSNPNDKILVLVYLVTSLIPSIPHPVPVLAGEKGAAKSTAMRVLRKLIDPAVEELLSLSNDPGAIALLLSTNYASYFDNLDGLSPMQSDILCRAVTGGGISKRKLFTDSDEVILQFKRCVALNGINPAATRPDLLDRSLLFTLERIPPERRKTEEDFWQDFEAARPYIFGNMLDVLCKAITIYPKVKLAKLPRMADFCKWGYAVAEAAGIGGETFLKAYWESISEQNEAAIQNHPVAAAVAALMEAKPNWNGTPAKLLNDLEKVAEGQRINIKSKTWPKAANALTRRLKEVQSNLLDIGIKFEETRNTDASRKRQITISKSIDVLSSEPHIASEIPICNASQADDIWIINSDGDDIVLIPSSHEFNNDDGSGELDDMTSIVFASMDHDYKYIEEEI